ncbi:MAG: hypothetical protein MJ229_00100 [bacterium]|nr:hypothetical protein [bacterium]
MGFDLNFNNNQPMIQNAQKSQDGGAGNLGYMRGRKKKGKDEDEAEMLSGSIFENAQDSFTHSDQTENESLSLTQIIEKFICYIKITFEKLFSSK